MGKTLSYFGEGGRGDVIYAVVVVNCGNWNPLRKSQNFWILEGNHSGAHFVLIDIFDEFSGASVVGPLVACVAGIHMGSGKGENLEENRGERGGWEKGRVPSPFTSLALPFFLIISAPPPL